MLDRPMMIPRKEECVDAVKQMAIGASMAHASGTPGQVVFGDKSRAKRLLLQAYAQIDGDDMLDDLVSKIATIEQTGIEDFIGREGAYHDASVAATDLADAFEALEVDAMDRQQECRL
jgi:hypothetical protein